MFREMRRDSKLMSKAEALEVLKKSSFGIISLNGDEGYPYGIPINYAIYDDKIVFHGALAGYKFDIIGRNPKACFTVAIEDQIVSEKFSTDFTSMIAFGQVKLVNDLETKKEILMCLINKYSPNYVEKGKMYIENDVKNTAVYAFEIEDLKGKKSRN